MTPHLLSTESNVLSVALAGNPNAGKSTLFNALTGARQHVSNWPGKTVEQKTGEFARHGRRIAITDLPGTYSLSAYTMEELVSRDYLLDSRPDAIIAVADATNLERNLYLIVQLLELELPTVVALNMMDVAAKQGLQIDIPELSCSLNVPVIPSIARQERGIDEIVAAVSHASTLPTSACSLDYGEAIERAIASLLVIINDYIAIREYYAPRWLAVRLLEGDVDVAARLSGLPGGSELLPAAGKRRAELAAALGEDIDLFIADRRYTWIHNLAGRVVRSVVLFD